MNLTPVGGLSDFGALVLGVLFLISLAFTVFGIRRATRTTTGSALPLWILLIVLFMPVGGLIALIVLKPKPGVDV